MPHPDETLRHVRTVVRTLFTDWAGGDAASVDRFMERVADDFSGLGTAPREIHESRDALRASTLREREAMVYPFRLDLSRLDARLFGETLALAEGELSIEIEMDGEVFVEAPRFSLLLERQGQRWLLVHFHMSVADVMQNEGDTIGELLDTRTRELQAEVARRTAELEAALDELHAAQARLVQQEKMASLGALTAGIAHEIKNPLNFVTNFAGLSRELVAELAEETDAEERRALLDDLAANAEKIEAHAGRADAIVRSMMEHARSGTGRRRRAALTPLVAEAVDRAAHGRRARTPDADVRVALDLDEGGEAEVVPEEIQRVLVNLLDNAFDAVADCAEPPGTPGVRVSLRRTDAIVAIRVEDDGPGMDAATLARATEPFFTTKPTGRGTGLGLSLSYDTVTQGHGGTMEIDSAPGRGTTVTVRLPVASVTPSAP